MEARQSLPCKDFRGWHPRSWLLAEDSVIGVASEMDVIEECGARLTGLTDKILDVKFEFEISNKE